MDVSHIHRLTLASLLPPSLPPRPLAGHLELAKSARRALSGRLGAAEQQSDLPLVFELSVSNADKPTLGKSAVTTRIEQFSGAAQPVLLTRAPLFIHKVRGCKGRHVERSGRTRCSCCSCPRFKMPAVVCILIVLLCLSVSLSLPSWMAEQARMLPGSIFVVGADTARRIVDKKYYGNDSLAMVAALSEIAALGCQFVVGGRMEGGAFLTLEDILAKVELPPAIKDIFIGVSVDDFRMDISSTELRAAAAAKGGGTG